MLKPLVKKLLLAPFWDSLIDRFADYGAVMMLHRVAEVNPAGLPENQSLKISPAGLDCFLSSAKKRGFAFISLDELAERLAQGRPLKKAMALTLDDGYRDNFTAALPVFRAHQAPATINLATGLMAGETIAWWNPLEQKIVSAAERGERFALPDGRAFSLTTLAERREAFRQARWWIQKFPLEQLDAALERLFGCSAAELRREAGDLYLQVEELAQYRDEPLLTFGLHTHHHFACENLDADGMRHELELNQSRLDVAGIHPHHFAYPYGRGIRSADHFGGLFHDLGFRTVATTFPDVIQAKTDPMFLPRLVLSEFAEDTQHPSLVMLKKLLHRGK